MGVDSQVSTCSHPQFHTQMLSHTKMHTQHVLKAHSTCMCSELHIHVQTHFGMLAHTSLEACIFLMHVQSDTYMLDL